MNFTNFKKIIIVLGIVIVLNLFVNYGVETFYKSPEFKDSCSEKLVSKSYSTQTECEGAGGLWNANQAYNSQPVVIKEGQVVSEPVGWCDVNFTCNKAFQEKMDMYNRNVFIVLVVAGIIAIIAGFLITNASTVALGLSFGGILSLIIGSIRYWSAMDDYLRFIILGLALAILIWIGIKKMSNE